MINTCGHGQCLHPGPCTVFVNSGNGGSRCQIAECSSFADNHVASFHHKTQEMCKSPNSDTNILLPTINPVSFTYGPNKASPVG